jgi:hypothetical protein
VKHIPHMDEMRNTYKIFDKTPEGKSTLESGVSGSIILKWILREMVSVCVH